MSLLELKKLSYWYSESTKICDELDMSFERG